MKKFTITMLSIPGILFVCLIIACNKKFDAPPSYTAPSITPTLTIAQLKAKHSFGNTETISTNDIIEGTVIANDSSGNFYKQIIIEDSTGGIAVNIDDYNLYTSYPVGRNVFINLNGLILFDDARLIELGASKDVTGAVAPIASPTKDKYVIKGNYGTPVAPIQIDVAALNDHCQNMLIQLNDFQFANADTSKIYADTSTSKSSINFKIQNCSGKTITLRTSGYASFAGINVPNGKGTITAIYSVFNTTPQLYIRDTSDVQFTGSRCDGSNGSGNPVQTTIANIRNSYSGSDFKLGAFIINGTVISDATNKNISSGSVVIQDATAGISIYLGGTISYNVGDSISINITGDTLQNYKGSLEINAYGSSPTLIATGKTIVPRQLTIAQINSSISTIENTLVKIVNATASGSSTYSGNNTLTDASGNLVLYTQPSATFASNNLPTVASDWIGYVKSFNNSNEFQIRNTSDVTTSSNGVDSSGGDGIDLTTSPVNLNFDDIASGLPKGVFVKVSSTSSSLGNGGTYNSTEATWNNTSSGFKNFASATGLTSSSDATAQNASTNRALGVKQTSAKGYDPGAAFVFELNNTTGKSNISLNFLLQSLDASIGRNTIWKVDYGIGDNPTSFTTVNTSSSLTTGPGFTSTPVTVNFGSTLDNKNSKIWIRIVTLDATTGSGSRASTAIDDVQFSW